MTEHVGHEVSQLKLVSTAKIRQHIFRDSRFNSFCASAKPAPQLWKICKHIFRSIRLNSFCASTNFGGLNM